MTGRDIWRANMADGLSGFQPIILDANDNEVPFHYDIAERQEPPAPSPDL